MKRLIYFLLLLVICTSFCSCGFSKYTEIEQKAKLTKYSEGEYEIVTILWVKQGYQYLTIEQVWRDYTDDCNEIDNFKKIQMFKAIQLKIKVDNILKNLK